MAAGGQPSCFVHFEPSRFGRTASPRCATTILTRLQLTSKLTLQIQSPKRCEQTITTACFAMQLTSKLILRSGCRCSESNIGPTFVHELSPCIVRSSVVEKSRLATLACPSLGMSGLPLVLRLRLAWKSYSRSQKVGTWL